MPHMAATVPMVPTNGFTQGVFIAHFYDKLNYEDGEDVKETTAYVLATTMAEAAQKAAAKFPELILYRVEKMYGNATILV